MHAHIVNAEYTDLDAVMADLADVIPNAQVAPGFVAGYWIHLDDSHVTALSVFETEDQARVTTPPVGSSMRGVTVTSVQIGEVVGSA
jgi:hypothetical protein